MSARTLSSRAGTAMLWQAGQLGGVKVIYLLRVIVLGRLLAPADFGLFAVALVALDFLMSVTDFGVVPALVHHSEPRRKHYEAAWTIGFLRAVAVAAGLIILAPWVATLFGEPDAAPLLRVLAARPVIEATASIGIAELRKELRFRSLAGLKLTEAVVNASVSILLVADLGLWALVAGPLVAAAAYSILSYVLAPMRPRLRLSGVESQQLARYGRWVLVSAWAALAGGTLLQLGISREFGAAALGLYFLASKLAFLPSDVSNQVVGAVVFPVFAKVQDDARGLGEVFRIAILGLTVLVAPVSLLIVGLAPSLVADVLGEQWVPALPVIRILALVPLLGIVGDVAVSLFRGIGRPDGSAMLDVVQYSLLIGLAWLLGDRYGVAGAAAAWLPAVMVSQILVVPMLRRALDRPFAGLAGPLTGILLASIIGLIGAVAFDRLVAGPLGALGAMVVGAILAYGGIAGLDRVFEVGLAAAATRLFPPAIPLLRRMGFPVAVDSMDTNDVRN